MKFQKNKLFSQNILKNAYKCGKIRKIISVIWRFIKTMTKSFNIIQGRKKKRCSQYELHVVERNNYGKIREKSILSTTIFERPSQKESKDDDRIQ